MAKAIDLFAGVGGLSQGFIQAGFDIPLAIEYKEDIAASFQKNHLGTEVIAKDIRDIDLLDIASRFKGIDVVMGGPPCQGFSQKGKRLNLSDERNFMFKHFVLFVETLKPKFFLLENVPTITTTNDGFFKDEIINSFREIGYDVRAKVLNAVNFGVPQNRRRAFFLGQLEKLDVELPEGNGLKTTIKEAIYDLPFILSGQGEDFYEYTTGHPLSIFQEKMRKESTGIFNHLSTKHSKIALERLALIPKGKGKEVLPKEHRTKSIYSGTWTRLKEDEQAATITTRFDTPSSGLFTHPILDRCLTVREAARIQSFPDKFIFHGNKSSQMIQVGNAVPPLLAETIAKEILKHL
jgi:DNA (cytosine-5)-methyltransferase 1